MNDYVVGKEWKQEKQKHILMTGFQLFAENGIEKVTMPDIAKASAIGRATLFRYFPSKRDLVIAISTWKWKEYLESKWLNDDKRAAEKTTAADQLKYWLECFIDLYRNHRDILCFNYEFNSFLKNESNSQDGMQEYIQVIETLRNRFQNLYIRGMEDDTLRKDLSEEAMFSMMVHIMLATVTRYAVGLVYVLEEGADPESELVMLVNKMKKEFCVD